MKKLAVAPGRKHCGKPARARNLARMWRRKVVQLAMECDVKRLVQRAPLERLIKTHLAFGVTHVSQGAINIIMEALVHYLHVIHTDAYYVTRNSKPARMWLASRDINAVVKAKGPLIIS